MLGGRPRNRSTNLSDRIPACRARVSLLALALAAALLSLSAALPATADAHGLVGRTDLPIPEWLFAWVAAVVLIVSFAALSLLWQQPRWERDTARRRFAVPVALRALVGAASTFIFGVVVYAGFAGTSVPTANLAPTAIYVVFWVGVPVLSIFLGDVWRVLSPWRAVARAGAWTLARLRGGHPLRAPLAYPEWLGRWPAAIGIAAFGWLELVYVDRDVPSTLAALALAYAVVQLVGMGLFGIERWRTRGDAFGVLFELFGRLAPIELRDGVVSTRPPLSGLARVDGAVSGTVALLAVMIGTTTFDGASNGEMWMTVSEPLRDLFAGLGVDGASMATGTIGLVGTIVVVGVFYWLGCAGMQTVGGGHATEELAHRFVHSLVPIAFGYLLAHYFSLLAFQGQAVAYLVSDPLGTGADLFGTANVMVDYTLVSTSMIWYVQVIALVAGHVAGLALAHDRALALYREPSDAVRSQYWMLVVMVGFTCLGLWLLSAVAT